MGKVKSFQHEQIEREQQLTATRWFRANNMSLKFDNSQIDRQKGIIKGVSVCTEGEALGHGVFLDSDFIADVVKFGNAFKKGVKARFGHPSMSGEALGTYIGRFKNFRVEDNKAVADLYLDESAKNSPNGNLFEYILDLAANPDVFGASIVFAIESYFFKKTTGESITTSDHYKNQDAGTVDYNLELDGYGYPKYYVKMKALYGSDLVDEPAANPDGLFHQLSSTNLHADKFAVIATQFLNAYPQIAEFVQENPHKITEFMKKFDKKPIGKKPLDDDDDKDLLLKKGKKKPLADADYEEDEEDDITDDVEDTDDDEGDGEDTDETGDDEETSDEGGEDEGNQALLSAISKMMDKKFSKRLKSIEKRLSLLEENPTADPSFSKKKKDSDGKKPMQLSSWEVEAEKRRVY